MPTKVTEALPTTSWKVPGMSGITPAFTLGSLNQVGDVCLEMMELLFFSGKVQDASTYLVVGDVICAPQQDTSTCLVVGEV